MQRLALFFLLLWTVPATAQSLSAIRLLYRDAGQSETAAQQFYAPLETLNDNASPVLQAYQAAGKILLARYKPIPARMPVINSAIRQLEELIQAYPGKHELYFIRLTLQEHLPKIVQYHQHINEDRQLLLEALPAMNEKGLQTMIRTYLNLTAE